MSWRGTKAAAGVLAGVMAPAADPANSGYQRVSLSPGIEFHIHLVKIFADVEIPVYDHVTGNQLIAPALFKVALSYMF